ncbi:MAG: tryptophan synthase subunit alpha [Clostridiales bacterium]|jgi:tryptophan synthase alpha chain|nr:tryptophan synthase subunit alpha [Clostridiales bacterium]
MNGLVKTMSELRAGNRKALIPFITGGYPDMEMTESFLTVLVESGADVIELGIPFSDPLADGPVLQAAATEALAGGTTPNQIFAAAARFREKYDTPLVFLVYYNMVFHRGLDVFCQNAAKAGISALVVPDLPFEEAENLDQAAEAAGLVNIRLLSPTTSDERLEKICKSAAGFIYCVAVTGVTGERAQMDSGITSLLTRAKKYTDVPLALGFGISTSAQAKVAAESADAVIVGSALTKIINESKPHNHLHAVEEFVRSLRSAIDGGEKYAG